MSTFRNSGFFYEYRNGLAYWITPMNPDGVAIGDTVAVLFDRSTNTLLKHGDPGLVVKQANRIRDAYLSSADPQVNQLVWDTIVVEIPLKTASDIDAMNRMVNTSGVVGTILLQLMKPGAGGTSTTVAS